MTFDQCALPRYALLPVLMLSSGVCSAGVLQFERADYRAFASARIVDEFDQQDSSYSSEARSFSAAAQASVSLEDPEFGLHTASGAGSVFWAVTYHGVNATLRAGAGGVAEAVSYGLDTYATGFGSLSLLFDIEEATIADLDSEGTYPTDLLRFDGSEFVPYYTGMSGPDRIELVPGRYRWVGSGGESVSGYSYYSSGVDFTLVTRAVPEPATAVAFAIGLVVLAARQRSGCRE